MKQKAATRAVRPRDRVCSQGCERNKTEGGAGWVLGRQATGEGRLSERGSVPGGGDMEEDRGFHGVLLGKDSGSQEVVALSLQGC